MSQQGDEPKPRECESCHWVIGVMMRNGRRTKLNVFVTPRPADPVNLDGKFSTIEMEQGVVVCQHCGAKNPWHFSQRAIDEMIERHLARTFGLGVSDG